jgi:hypothetical protein
MTEAQWLVFARAERLPPMPWFNLRDMSDQDLTDIYRYIRSLGPAGTAAPAPWVRAAKSARRTLISCHTTDDGRIVSHGRETFGREAVDQQPRSHHYDLGNTGCAG